MMNSPSADQISKAVAQFATLQQNLYQLSTNAKAEADRLASATVDCRTASADLVWSVLWDKPLYTNRGTDEAKAYVKAISSEMPGAWRQMAAAFGPYHIRRKGKVDWADDAGRSNDSFEVNGRVVDHFLLNHNIAYQVSFAIVGAGRALCNRSATSSFPYADLHGQPLHHTVKSLSKEFGWNWGHTTVLHFLTDLGLAIKPDRHLVRTIAHLGLFFCKNADEPSLKEALQINDVVRAMCWAFYGSDGPASLRTMDKNLMDISERGLLT